MPRSARVPRVSGCGRSRWFWMEVITVPAVRAPRIQSVGGGAMVLLHDVTLEHPRALDLARSVEGQAESMRHIQKSHMKDQERSRGAPVTIAMVDPDDVKEINDMIGRRAAGDRALQTFADVLRTVCRAENHKYRRGGDEFMILTISRPQDVLEERLQNIGRRATPGHRLRMPSRWVLFRSSACAG